MPASRVVIVIVSYGRPDDVGRCLLAVSKFPDDVDFEAVVVENAGAEAYGRLVGQLQSDAIAVAGDGVAPIPVADARGVNGARTSRTFGLAGADRPLTLVEASDNLGYSGGINVALRAIKGRAGWDAVWVLNPDTMPEPNALQAVQRHTREGGYGLVGSRLVFSQTGRVQMRGATWRPLIARGLGLGVGEPADAEVDVAALERRLDWISGAAMYATRDFIEAVGEMDDSYFLYCEDVDWALRRGVFKLGYAHHSIVQHEHGTTIGSSFDHTRRSDLSVYLMERNRLLLTRRHYPAIYPLVALICLAGLGQRYALPGNWRGLATSLKGWWAGVRGKTGRPMV